MASQAPTSSFIQAGASSATGRNFFTFGLEESATFVRTAGLFDPNRLGLACLARKRTRHVPLRTNWLTRTTIASSRLIAVSNRHGERFSSELERAWPTSASSEAGSARNPRSENRFGVLGRSVSVGDDPGKKPRDEPGSWTALARHLARGDRQKLDPKSDGPLPSVSETTMRLSISAFASAFLLHP